ncbi:MAG: hypothetical protein RL572_693 [Pseudomonadota bacterium]
MLENIPIVITSTLEQECSEFPRFLSRRNASLGRMQEYGQFSRQQRGASGHFVQLEARLQPMQVNARLRQTDVVARYPGEEFVLLLNGINLPETALERADKAFNRAKQGSRNPVCVVETPLLPSAPPESLTAC